MTGSASRSALVAGAGIVGIACASWLQRDGWSVTLVDPADPAEAGASAGNAGLIAVHIARPIGMPGIWKSVPKMLADPAGPLSVDPAYLPRIAPWLVRLLFASAPAKVGRIAGDLKRLLDGAWAGLDPLVASAGAGDLVARRGVFVAYPGEAERAVAKVEHDLLRGVGVRIEPVDAAGLRERLPGLGPRYGAAVFFPDSGHSLEPQALARRLFDRFVADGGTFVRAPLEGFRDGGGAIHSASVGGADRTADLYVCAAGIWSGEICRRLGYRTPLDTERGYHITVADPGVDLPAPVILSDAKFAVTPMAPGIRFAGTIEFAGTAAPPKPARFDALLAGARRAFPGLRTDRISRWMGFRPSFPDSLPAIGRAPRHGNLLVAFGHGHLGLTLAGVTGRLVAELASDAGPSIDLSPYRLDRFAPGVRP